MRVHAASSADASSRPDCSDAGLVRAVPKAQASGWQHRRIEARGLRISERCKSPSKFRELRYPNFQLPSAEKAFGVSMDTLMRMQNAFDIAQARSREGEITVSRYTPKAKTTPQPSLL